ncbi:hypothetical protein DRN73_02840 [Candidatus Pacearchaeota archaeon]|nr:MAG: hypothetical protein DRN73_02840 [Candidatus Pacearchaeota archaeon]
MNLGKKKKLAAKTLKMGKKRIKFVKSRLEEIKEAITKQDIRDLTKDKAIIISEKKGRQRKKKRKTKKSTGNIRKKTKTMKRDYVILTRKLRNYVREIKNRGELSAEEAKEIRKKIRNKDFKRKSDLKDYIGGLKK